MVAMVFSDDMTALNAGCGVSNPSDTYNYCYV